MVSLRRRRYLVIYPEYFNKNRSRKLGRRVSLEMADESPTLKKLVKACEILKYDFEVEPEKAHPSNWWNSQGRILLRIDKNNKRPKEEVLKEIAGILKKLVPKKKKKKKETTKEKPSLTKSSKGRKKGKK